ncbi:MAG: hypothetical protein CEE43_18835 [Promethearchaeota archaeon Loki_b32]|nr:MAG: hypothetical protein CEE43_18835 [Candidatus Lokiarchaeota archaeon Loki_b32]
MKELSDIPEFSKYFQVISPSEINIDKDNIFYRDKYNDIINFLKVMLTNHHDTTLNGYIEPKGAVLINVNPGTDILDYLKLITKNYYLDLIEFNDNEIIKAPNRFLKSFISILEDFGRGLEKEDEIEISKRESDKKHEKKLLLINQQLRFKHKFEEISLLEIFLNARENKSFNFKFIDSNLILVWLNYDIQDINSISDKLYKTFDLFIKIPLLNKIERETVLKDFLEKNTKIVFDINDIVNYTENWEVKDILQLLKVGIFKHFLNSELNDTSNEITDVLIDLIVSGEFIPNIITPNSNNKSKVELKEEYNQNKQVFSPQEPIDNYNFKDVSGIIQGIRESRISDFMLNQLYENAASKNYTELVLIIDKLAKKEPLEENEMKMIAKYPFILNDSPNRAQINLEKAKKRVDLIKQAFGK